MQSWEGGFMIEKYALYDDENEQIIELADTEEELKGIYKTSKLFRKMVNKEPFQMVKVSLTQEEYNDLINGK